jgi:hypothetical protein
VGFGSFLELPPFGGYAEHIENGQLVDGLSTALALSVACAQLRDNVSRLTTLFN